MNDRSFDPYRQWLGIPPNAQPPNHYRLLGVELLETDADIIDTAAQRQMSFVRTFALGEHGEYAQSLLNELAKARAILLDPVAKAKYDAWLTAQSQPSESASPAPSIAVSPQGKVDIATTPLASRKPSRPKTRSQKTSSKRAPMFAGIIGLLLVSAVVAYMLAGSKQPVVAERPVNEQPSEEVQVEEVQVVEVEDEVQPAQPPSEVGSILDSAKPTPTGVAAEDVEEPAEAPLAEVEPEPRAPLEPEQVAPELAGFSSDLSNATNEPPPAIAPFDAEQAKAHQAAWEEHLGLAVEIENSIGMKLRVIPPGTFMMGSEDGPDHEKPVHQVTLTKPILLGVYEVTQSEYQQVMGNNPSRFKGSRNPVEMLTWEDANEFCRRLSLLPREKRAGRVYRLPTQAEWEFACRAGTTTKYSYRDDESLLSSYGWYKENGGGTTHPVGSKIANPFGLHDMHGNVWEWCNDWYGSYPSGSVTNPVGPESGSDRVSRGGSWNDGAGLCRSAYLYGRSRRISNGGFRVACVPSGNTSAEFAASPPMDSGADVEPDAVPSPPIPEPASDGPAPAIAPFDAADAKALQGKWARHLGERVEVTNSIGMKLRVVPPGTFTMGEGNDAHEVTLTTPLLFGVYEVTQSEYQQVMGSNPSRVKWLRNPVEMVTWDDANEFCRRLSLLAREKRAGRVYRLPTEAEWEFAFRAGTTTTYSFGANDSLLSRYAWYRENAGGTTHPVGSKLANPFGLYDMHGNVWEWCNDWYGRYSTDSVTDPKGPQSGPSRVLRGGSFGDYAVGCRSAHRARDLSNPKNYGFRVACTLSSE
ncbi:MAG: SUMF1/EgtB/PvdO family nonheme iron enzyme [Planctomycetaceae bacterium]|nr:SUMF1/EgtB/PvdO family nonheme iron enzyme [Planctomycetaceae bacterium]